jgi:hypothetical protein
MKIRTAMILWGFCTLFSCAIAFPAVLEEPRNMTSELSPEIEEGRLFTVEKKISIPEVAYPTLKMYLRTLFFSRPLPWPYQVEKFDVRDEKILLQGRVLSPGKYVIPLGVFWWNGKSYVLPSFSCTSTPAYLPPLTVADLLLPFPEKALFPSAHNVQAENELLTQNQVAGRRMLFWYDFWRHAFVMTCLFLVCLPCSLQLWRWWRLKRNPEVTIPVVSPSTVFQEVKDLQRQRETPWSKLVYVLNLVASVEMPSLTSYELEQRFTAAGESALAEAASCIENYSYRPEGDQYFDQAVELVEKGLTEKRLM